MMTFDHQKRRFDPQRLSFDPKGIDLPKYEFRPNACNECHKIDSRPNWDPYFHWPGFYGVKMTTRTRGYDFKNRQLNKGVEKVNLDAFAWR